MNNLFLPNSVELTQISNILNISEDEVKERISKGFKKLNIELEETDDAGVLFSQIVSDYGFEMFAVTLMVIGRSEVQINELFGNLFYKNTSEDCPQCGCETETDTDGCWGQEWEEKKCLNSNCDWSESGEPDWDLKRDIALDR